MSMRDEKWIGGLHGEMPVALAARRALTARIGVVLERLPAAVERADEDLEHVHQLRVGTRRAGAAVRIFATVLPGRLHRRLRRTLRAVRRAAGAARDWDVFLEMLAARNDRRSAKQVPGFDFLIGFGHGQRVAAQAFLRQATEGQGQELQSLSDEIENTLEPGSHPDTLRDLAVPMLTQMLHELEEAARGDLTAYEALHQVRIRGKHLRYAMELFESCFAPPLRHDVYPRVAEMQEILGLANDSHVTTLRLDELRRRLEQADSATWTRCRFAIDALQRYHRRRLSEQRRSFMTWWAAWEKAGYADALVRLLRTSA
jgi:CHAD domain-containing protein